MKVRLIDPRAAAGEAREIRGVVDGRRVIWLAEKGKPVELPDDIGASLLEQSDVWAPSGEDAKKVADKVAASTDGGDS